MIVIVLRLKDEGAAYIYIHQQPKTVSLYHAVIIIGPKSGAGWCCSLAFRGSIGNRRAGFQAFPKLQTGKKRIKNGSNNDAIQHTQVYLNISADLKAVVAVCVCVCCACVEVGCMHLGLSGLCVKRNLIM